MMTEMEFLLTPLIHNSCTYEHIFQDVENLKNYYLYSCLEGDENSDNTSSYAITMLPLHSFQQEDIFPLVLRVLVRNLPFFSWTVRNPSCKTVLHPWSSSFTKLKMLVFKLGTKGTHKNIMGSPFVHSWYLILDTCTSPLPSYLIEDQSPNLTTSYWIRFSVIYLVNDYYMNLIFNLEMSTCFILLYHLSHGCSTGGSTMFSRSSEP